MRCISSGSILMARAFSWRPCREKDALASPLWLIDCWIEVMYCNREKQMNSGKTWNQKRYVGLLALLFLTASSAMAGTGDDIPGRDPRQAIDTEYTKKILEYTTQPM